MPEPEKRFTVTFSTEAAMKFQGRLFASGVMRILGMVQGNIATGRWNGDVSDLAGNKIGEWTTAWRSDPPRS